MKEEQNENKINIKQKNGLSKEFIVLLIITLIIGIAIGYFTGPIIFK